MDQIEVRLAQKSDMKKLAQIQTSSWKSAFNTILSSETLERYTDVVKCTEMLERAFDANRGTFYIASLNDEPCGEIFWCNTGDDTPEFAQIIAIHSLANSWGTGMGKAMMNRVLADIHKSGKTLVYLWVFKDNVRARKFYEKCGFIANGEEKTSDFGDVIEVKYVKQL